MPEHYKPRAIIFVAPPFRHTHFDGKQVVVHNRSKEMHEVWAYNLYPGPSAKKGVFSLLLDIGEQEGWVCCHTSAAMVETPYECEVVFMHEGVILEQGAPRGPSSGAPAVASRQRISWHDSATPDNPERLFL